MCLVCATLNDCLASSLGFPTHNDFQLSFHLACVNPRMSDPSNTSKFAAGFPPGPTQSATTSAATSLPQGLQHAMSSASPIAPPASAATSAPTIVTRTSPSLVEWAIERNLKQSFLDPSNPALKCQLDAINTVLVDEGLPSVNDITGLVTNEDLKKELFALFQAQTLATKNTLSKIVAQLCTSLSEKKSDKRETEDPGAF